MMPHSLRQLLAIFIFTCISTVNLFSQGAEDSLVYKLNSGAGEKEELKIAYELARRSVQTDSAKYFMYYNISLELAKKLNDEIAEAKLYLMNGNYYSDRNVLKALENASRSFDIISRTDSSRLLSAVYSLYGSIYFNIGNYSKSFEYYLSSLKIDEKNNFHSALSGDYNNLAIIYSCQYNNKKALEYYFKALELNEKSGRKKWYCVNLMNISISYGEMDSTELQLKFATDAFNCAKEINDEILLADVTSNLGEVLVKRGEMGKASEYFDYAESIYTRYGEIISLYYLYQARGGYYKALKDYPRAIEYYMMTLKAAQDEQIQDLALQSSYELSQIYKSLNDYKEAFHYFELYHNVSDSISNVEKTKKITELELQYDFDKQMEIKRFEEEEQQKVLNLQRKIILFSVTALFLAICLIFTIVINLRAGRRTNKLLEAKNTHIQEQTEAIARSSEELRGQRDQLKLLNATKDKLYSIIAHDLKNPFNVLLGFTTLLEEQWDELDEENKKMYVSQLNKAASGSYELLHNLLDWALTQSGRLTVSGECIKVEKSVNEAFLSLNSHAALKGIELLNSTAPDTKVFCDLNMFSTVLRNLISNAIKFTPENGRVNISADKSETIVSIIVEDNGVGISEENLIGLFNIETHFSTRGTQNERGTGLGLIVCKEFVEKNNGSINVESKPGAGTRFIVTLPSC